MEKVPPRCLRGHFCNQMRNVELLKADIGAEFVDEILHSRRELPDITGIPMKLGYAYTAVFLNGVALTGSENT